jgi:transcription elongation factor GreA
MVKYFTKDGLEKLKKELDRLERDGRKQVAEKMKHAISFGDISENAAYDDAREEHGMLEGRIAELKATIATAKLVEKKVGGDIQVGSRVSLICDGKPETYEIVSPEETDVLNGRISYQSPLGKLLVGKFKGGKVELKIPEGKIEYKIVKVE